MWKSPPSPCLSSLTRKFRLWNSCGIARHKMWIITARIDRWRRKTSKIIKIYVFSIFSVFHKKLWIGKAPVENAEIRQISRNFSSQSALFHKAREPR